MLQTSETIEEFACKKNPEMVRFSTGLLSSWFATREDHLLAVGVAASALGSETYTYICTIKTGRTLAVDAEQQMMTFAWINHRRLRGFFCAPPFPPALLDGFLLGAVVACTSENLRFRYCWAWASCNTCSTND